MIRDPYEVLGIRPDATDTEVKNAYRRLARKYPSLLYCIVEVSVIAFNGHLNPVTCHYLTTAHILGILLSSMYCRFLCHQFIHLIIVSPLYPFCHTNHA